jgi:hypothetical protein
MSPFAMINVCARAVPLFHSQPTNQQPTQKHTQRHAFARGKRHFHICPCFTTLLLNFDTYFGWAEISLLLNLTPAAPARIINPGKARAGLSLSLSLCAIPSALRAKQLSLAPGESRGGARVCPVANLRVCISQPLRYGAGILNYLHAPLTLARALQTYTYTRPESLPFVGAESARP